MRRANKIRVVEKNLSEHIRFENEAYRKIIRKRLEAERFEPGVGCPDRDWCRNNGCYWFCKDRDVG